MQDSLRVLLDCGIQVKTILDVGIYTGTQPLMEVFPKTKHHLFEPVDLHFNTISANYKNIPHELHHVALSDTDGRVYLACCSINNGEKITHSQIVPKKLNSKDMPGLVSCTEVRQAKLDTIIDGNLVPSPYLLKVDVDGYEIPVLKGALRVLNNSSVVVIEAPLNKANLPNFFERSQYLMDSGFYLVDIVDLAYYDGVLWQADLVFVRKDIVNTNDRLRPFESDTFAFEGSKWSLLSDRI